jgi:hypothetical protein
MAWNAASVMGHCSAIVLWAAEEREDILSCFIAGAL